DAAQEKKDGCNDQSDARRPPRNRIANLALHGRHEQHGADDQENDNQPDGEKSKEPGRAELFETAEVIAQFRLQLVEPFEHLVFIGARFGFDRLFLREHLPESAMPGERAEYRLSQRSEFLLVLGKLRVEIRKL